MTLWKRVDWFQVYPSRTRKIFYDCNAKYNSYSFDGGERFEPDYLLVLHKQNEVGYEQLQVFIEPKGTHLIAEGKWKEDFLHEIEDKAVATKIFVDNSKYKIWSFYFRKRSQMRGSILYLQRCVF